MNITTKHTSNANGATVIVAKGAGRQRTVQSDPAKSPEWNAGNAAGTLALALGLDWSEDITHEYVEAGKHKFTFPA